MLLRRYGLAPRTHLEERGGRWVLFSDYPLREFILNDSARQLVAVLDGETPLHRLVLGDTRDAVRFLEEKVRSGMLTVRYEVETPREWPAVEVVIPVYENAAGLRRCLDGVAAQSYPREQITVTVVDDASRVSLLQEMVGAEFDGLATSWRHLGTNLGAGEARNAGAGIFHGIPEDSNFPVMDPPPPLLAFVDSDCVPHRNWLENLVAALDQSEIAAIGGAVRGANPQTWLGGYEAECASLFMGEKGGTAACPDCAVPYLPACNLLVRRAVFDKVGGFRPGMRVGEDVDLSWRLAAAGEEVFYFPPGVVFHEYRHRLLPFLGRKRDYGSSEAQLRGQHPHRFHSRAGWLTVVATALLGAGLELWSPWLLVAGLLFPFAAAAASVVKRPGAFRVFAPTAIAAAFARGAAAITLRETRRLTRVSLLFWTIPLAIWPGLMPLAALVFALAALGEWLARRPRIGMARFLSGFAAECLAYSLGKLAGEAVHLVRAVFSPKSHRRAEVFSGNRAGGKPRGKSN